MNLPPRSIYAFNDLASMFLSQFAANKPKRLEVTDLFDIRQAGGESLKSYMTRFNDATVRVDDPDQKFLVKAFQMGLRVGPFSDALALQKPTSMEEIRLRAEKHIEMEESRFEKREAEHVNRDSRPKPLNKQQPLLIGGRDPPRRHEVETGLEAQTKFPQAKFTPLKEKRSHILREICHTRLLSFPQAAGGKQLGKNRREWCDFHRAVDHSTEECWTLGAQIEGLVQQGRLGHYIVREEEGKDNRRGESSRGGYGAKKGNRGNSGANLTPLGGNRRGRTISFEEEDRRCDQVGDEPMVISVAAEGFKVERVLVDQSSSTNILYGSTFGEGRNARRISVVYIVIEAEAFYNIIMGRLALNRLKVVVSKYHLCMKYPTAGGVGAIWADASVTKNLRVGQRKAAVNTLSLELDPRCHEERERPLPMEKLKEVQVGWPT
ncbi:hypothetical protein CR513_26838, partial [Mucuna pruriens]